MQSVAEARPRLIVNHVTRQFGSGRTAVTAVDDVSLTVSAGEAVLIMGPSGSGKSTLLSMLGGLLSPSEGSIVLDSTEITALDERALPDIRLRHFGFVFQDFNLLPALSALENVALVAELAGMPHSASRQKATDLLSRFDLSERLDHRPEHLSGGEKQRVALARALINDPTLILADEPTANLDSSIGHQVMRLLRDIAGSEQRGVIIVSHDERLKAIADRVLWLEDGRLAETSRLLLDPVCGMAVAPERAVTIELDGRTVAFCARGCRDEFLADPHRFADASRGPADRGQEA